MSPYATATLDNLREKRNRSPEETALLITLLAQATADAPRPPGINQQSPPVPIVDPRGGAKTPGSSSTISNSSAKVNAI